MYVIAEIGCNHNGSAELAHDMVRVAKECGVDAVKFQTFNSEALISRYAPKAEYQIKNTGAADSQLEMTKKLELSHEEYLKLRAYAEELGLDVFSTGFDLMSNKFLYEQGQKIWKIPSGEITNLPYLRQLSEFLNEDMTVILSTGMSTIDEIKEAVDILKPEKKFRLIIMHCHTEYPTEDEDVNILAINDLKRAFPEYEIGFSDHSRGVVAPVLSVSLGVKVIEKHFTLDRNLPGPDHKASVTPDELKIICESVRRAEKMLGDGIKHVTDAERKNIIVARKSIVAKCEIKKGEIFSADNITCKRPGNGISPMLWDEVIGKISNRDYCVDELIEL